MCIRDSDLSRELETLAVEGVSAEARSAAVRLERREIFSVLSLIHISEPTRLLSISYAVFCLKKKK